MECMVSGARNAFLDTVVLAQNKSFCLNSLNKKINSNDSKVKASEQFILIGK